MAPFPQGKIKLPPLNIDKRESEC
ncbi:uncharacterized protein G2W53_022021 [Senna tora]|uniref:Uncharacterized protein n=1 Tax=Senna tora TaxID=362788 RepID=A0A834TM02_9FABA|nr:uncharacterized protein G2W53_022021 [Senna tora]